MSELDVFIANLEARRKEVQELVGDSPLKQEILQLQEQLEREKAKERELTQTRDLAWKIYYTYASKMAELGVLASDSSSNLINQYSQEVLQFQEQLEREQAKKRELTQTRDLTWEAYQTLTRKEVEVRIAAQVMDTEIRFAVPAVEPKWPVAPKKKLNISIAGVLGLMVGVFGTFVLEYFSSGRTDHG